MRSQKVLYNVLGALLMQIVTIVCGFIVPRLLIDQFGAENHGIVASISQFLGYIVLAEAGVGGVTRAALYEPLAERDSAKISGILKATERFFRTIAFGFVGYSLCVAAGFALFGADARGFVYTFSLVLIIAASTFIEYFFGISNTILLNADQKVYIHSVLRVVMTVLQLVVVYVLIRFNSSLHVVKLCGSLVFMILPLYLHRYVKRHYPVDRGCEPNNEAIKQRWNGLGQHIAFFLHTHTDVVVLTLFANFIEVSVYAVHYLVVSGIERIVYIFTSGFESAFGDMLARKETDALDRSFRIYELISSSVTIIFFTTAALLINPFITLYTRGIADASYQRGLFAYILLLSEAVYCIRQPYHTVIVAAGHFKETQSFAFLEAGVNIALSVLLVIHMGIVGVAIGTLAAMTLRTVFCAIYLKGEILYRDLRFFVCRQIVTALNAVAVIASVRLIFQAMVIHSYWAFVQYGVMIAGIALLITLAFTYVFYPLDLLAACRQIRGLLKPNERRRLS